MVKQSSMMTLVVKKSQEITSANVTLRSLYNFLVSFGFTSACSLIVYFCCLDFIEFQTCMTDIVQHICRYVQLV